MRGLYRALFRHLYGAIGISILILISGWLLVDIAELARHIDRVGWSAALPLYMLRGPVLMHRLLPLTLIIGMALTIGHWASARHLQNAVALGLHPARLPLLAAAATLPVVLIWSSSSGSQIPPLHRAENLMLYRVFRIGGQHYGTFHRPSGLAVENDWLVRFQPTGPTHIKDLEAVRLNAGQILERVSAASASLSANGWHAENVQISRRVGGEVISERFADSRLPFFQTTSALDYAIGFPDEFPSAYLATMAERASTAGSDPRPFLYEAESRRSRGALLLLTLIATALITARIGPGASFNVILARATVMAAGYELAAFVGAALALVLVPSQMVIAAWLPVALMLVIALRGLQRVGRQR